MPNLNELSYPRHLHKNNGHKDNPHGDFLVVNSASEAEAALKDGWSIEAFPPNYAEKTPDPPKTGNAKTGNAKKEE